MVVKGPIKVAYFAKYRALHDVSFVCLYVRLSVCDQSSVHRFRYIVFVFFPQVYPGNSENKFETGQNGPKVKVKVTQNVKNTFLAITQEPSELERSG